MEFVRSPNLPQGDITLALVDGRIDKDLAAGFERLGIRLIETRPHPGVYSAISGHSDIMVFHAGGNRVVYAPGTSADVIRELEEEGFELLPGNSPLTSTYPGDISYNVARVGRYAFHNTRYTDPVIRSLLEQEGVEMVHVNQGYAKCATAVIGQAAILTADRGIARAAEKFNVDVLLLDPDQGIRLPGLGVGMDCGFVGGASGMIGRDKWAIAGHFDSLPAAGAIRRFLNDRGIEPVSLSTLPVLDLGSVLPLKCRPGK